MTVLTNTLEGGGSGNPVSAASSGGISGKAFDVVALGGTPTLIYDSAQAANGFLSAHLTMPAALASAYMAWTTSMGTQTTVYFRVSLWHAANPSVSTKIWQADIGGATLCGILFLLTTGHLQFEDSTGGNSFTTTNAVPLSSWYRVEGSLTGNAATGQVTLQLYTSPDGSSLLETFTGPSTWNTGGQPDSFRYGQFGAITQSSQFDIFFDDMGLSNVGAMGPPAAQTAAALGTLGPYKDPGISSSDGTNTFLNNNMFNGAAVPGWVQMTTAYTPINPSVFWVYSNVPVPAGGAIVAYPDIQQVYPNLPLTHWSGITATWTEAMNSTASSVSWAAFDCWFNSFANEVLIAVDNHGISTAGDTDLGPVTLGGLLFETFHRPSSTEYLYVLQANTPSGSVDLLAIFRHAQANGYIPAGALLNAIEFGWEISTTNSLEQVFQLSAFTITETIATGAQSGDDAGRGLKRRRRLWESRRGV